MLNKNDIISDLYKSPILNEIINKITSRHQLTDDLKAELFLILCEMKEDKIIKAHESNYLIYLCINILKKQYHSSTSPFHKKYRKEKFDDLELIDDENDENLKDKDIQLAFDEISDREEMEYMMDKIKWIVDNKLNVTDRELFKLYYKWERYDRWLGELRDVSCDKEVSSYRKIEKKLAITTITSDGSNKKISIGRSTISLSHQRSIDIIKKWLNKI
ncbi:MAG: hypothetical protein ACOVK2_06990 [Candidatus Fonsibacter sp.]